MNKSTLAAAFHLHLFWWWPCVLLVPLLAGACKPRKMELVCRPVSIFEVVEPEQNAGTAPFSIERLGREVESGALMRVPTIITVSGNNHTSVDWEFLHHIYGHSGLIYLPAEGLARRPDSKEIFPMKRFSDGKSERLRFGFRSKACPKRDQYGTWVYCEYGNDELFLAMDMTCESTQAE